MPAAIAEFLISATAQAGAVAPGFAAALVFVHCLFGRRIVLHPFWCFSDDRLAPEVEDAAAGKYLIPTPAGLTVLSMGFVLSLGGASA